MSAVLRFDREVSTSGYKIIHIMFKLSASQKYYQLDELQVDLCGLISALYARFSDIQSNQSNPMSITEAGQGPLFPSHSTNLKYSA